tara:strand:+ start:197 stop:460 length:264 start_codon:yes stop_codon:yes gene_type:complete
MTEEITKETMTVDGVPHIVEDMTPDQQYYIRQIKDLQLKSSNTRMVLDQITVASKAFTSALVESLKAAEDADEAADDAEVIDAKKVN